MSSLRQAFNIAGPAAVALGLVAAGLFVDNYWRYVLSLTAEALVVGLALAMLLGYARCVSLATGAMGALGAYTAALLIIHLDPPFLLAVLAAAAVGGLGGFVLAVPGVRFRGHNLAMVTLVFQMVVIIVLRELNTITGGAEGLTVPAPYMFGLSLHDDMVGLVVSGLVSAAVLLPLAVVLDGAFGKNLRAIAANEVAARAYGIRVEHHLIAAFTISSAAIAASAALAAPHFRIIDPETFGIHHSIFALAYPIVGGLNSLWGGVVGGGVMRLAPEVLRPIADYIQLILSAIVIATVLFFRGGLVDLFGLVARRLGWKSASAAPHEATGEPTPAPRPVHDAQPAVGAPSHALVARGIVKRYGALTAVDNVDLSIETGTLHGVMGPNGAGKTTFFNAVTGFIEADAGHITLFGEDAASGRLEDRVALGISRTFQHVAVFPALTCLDNVVIGLGRNRIGHVLSRSFDGTFGGRATKAEREAAHWALQEVGIGALAETRADQLSLGNQRRLEIARAIVSRPRLILLDEPVSGVSHNELERIVDLLKRLNRELGATMLVVEHNIGFLVSLCDRVSVMAEGRIIADGPPHEVIARAEVRRIYFGDGEEAA